MRDHESYTRHYRSLGQTAGFYVPNGGKDPEKPNERYRIRGNGIRVFTPALTAGEWTTSAHASSNLAALDGGGVAPAQADQAGEVIFKVEGANVITSLRIQGRCVRQTAADVNRIAVSTVNGLVWKTVWENEQNRRNTLRSPAR